MGILHWCIGFISIIIVLSWAQFGKQAETQLVHSIIEKHVQETFSDLYKKVTDKARNALPKDPKEDSTPRKLSSKLHVTNLFQEQSPVYPAQKELFFKLVDILYGSLPLFKPNGHNKEEVRELFEEAFEYLKQHNDKKMHVSSLANVIFDGFNKDKKQYILFHMLNGGETEICPKVPCVIPKLLDFVTTDNHKSWADLYLARPQIILTIVNDKQATLQILEYRKQLFKQLSGIENKENLEKEFETAFSSYLPSEIAPHISYGISKTTPNNKTTLPNPFEAIE